MYNSIQRDLTQIIQHLFVYIIVRRTKVQCKLFLKNVNNAVYKICT